MSIQPFRFATEGEVHKYNTNPQAGLNDACMVRLNRANIGSHSVNRMNSLIVGGTAQTDVSQTFQPDSVEELHR